MKIAIFTDVFLDNGGGIVTSIRAQKKQLEKMGHEVYLFSPGFRRTDKELKELEKQHIFAVPTCKTSLGGIPFARRPAIVEKWIQKRFPNLKGFDVVHVHYEAGCSLAGIRMAKKNHIRLIQTMHAREDLGVEDLIPKPFQYISATLLNFFHGLYLPHNCKIKKDHDLVTTRTRAKMWTLMISQINEADALLVPSEHFAEELRRYKVKCGITIISNGLEDALFEGVDKPKTLKKGEPIRIMWNNRLDKNKRIMDFLEALTMVKVPYLVSVFGDGFEEKNAKAYVKKHGLNVKFGGVVDHDTIIKEIDKSQLSVMASYHFDNQPMTIIEAEVRGVPVLICDPNMCEIMPDGGYYLTKSPETKYFADAINEIGEHPEMIVKMSKAMLKGRDERRQSKQAEKLIKLYAGKGK